MFAQCLRHGLKFYASMLVGVFCVSLFLQFATYPFIISVTKNKIKDGAIQWRFQKPGVNDSNTTHTKTNRHVSYPNCKHNSHPSTRNYFITFQPTGRLGNIMFEYAALLGLANVNNRTPFVLSTSILTSTFRISHVKDIPHTQRWRPFPESYFGKYETRFNCLPPRDVMLNGYFQSYKYFENVKSTVMSEFRFVSPIARKAEEMFSSLLGGMSKRNITVVGVHVRRGDVAAENGIGRQMAPVSYFQKAFDWARKKYNDVVFVVASNDIEWSKDHLKHNDVMIAPNGDREVHLCVLTKCDHVIISVGTFGWWAGFLSDGDVIYYNQTFTPGSFLSKGFDAKDHFLPNWIGMGS